MRCVAAAVIRALPLVPLVPISLIAQRGAAARETAARPPQLTAVPDLRLTAASLGLTGSAFGRGGHVALSPDGRIVVAPQVGDLVDLDSTGKRLSWKIQVGGRDPEIWMVDRMGWAGNTMWVIDQGFRQIALVDARGKITKSLEHPSWVRPAWADRRKYPVYSRVTPLSLYPDGSWLVIPYREKSLLDTPGYDTTVQYLMRISESGSIQRVVARVPREPARVDVTSGKTTRSFFIPYRAQGMFGWSPDGTRIGIVSANTKGADSATFRLTVIGEKGDTLVNRLYPYTPIRITPQARDSVRERTQGKVGTLTEEEVRNRIAEQIPPFYPPVSGLVIGRDNTIWVQLRTAPSVKSGDLRTWLVLDPAGAPIGSVSLPHDFVVEVASRERLWGFERQLGQPPVIARYRITRK
jgi:hypothetical protein